MAFILLFGFCALELVLSLVKLLVFYNKINISGQSKWKKLVYLELDLLLFIFVAYYLVKVNVYCGFWDVFILPAIALITSGIYFAFSKEKGIISSIKTFFQKKKEGLEPKINGEKQVSWVDSEQWEYSRCAIILFCFFGLILSASAGTLLIFSIKNPTSLGQILQFLIIDKMASDPLLQNYREILKAIDEFTITVAILGSISTITQILFIKQQTEVNKDCKKLVRLKNRLNDIGSEM